MTSEKDAQDLVTTQLKTFFHDSFLSHDHVAVATTQTSASIENVTQLLLSTGVQESSEIRANYDRAFFNPRYGTLRVKARFNSADDVFAFIGFKKTLAAPTWNMTESHAGIMIYNGHVYAVTGGSAKGAAPDLQDFQATIIPGIDATRWLVYEVAFNKVRYYSIPFTVPYFDREAFPKIKEGLVRKWSGQYANGNVLPADEMHYLVFYVKNAVGAQKYVDVQHVTYSEIYPD